MRARNDAADLSSAAQGVSHICCGLAGQAYALLALGRIDPTGPWRRRALNLAAIAMTRGTVDVWPISLFKGICGNLCLGIDLLSRTEPRFPCIGPE
jgi:hypothetical protein